MVTSVIVRILEIVDETVMKSKQWQINKKDQRKQNLREQTLFQRVHIPAF